MQSPGVASRGGVNFRGRGRGGRGGRGRQRRCRLFPTCPYAERCRYHHPTKVCPYFPKCKFADDECSFLHPVSDENVAPIHIKADAPVKSLEKGLAGMKISPTTPQKAPVAAPVQQTPPPPIHHHVPRLPIGLPHPGAPMMPMRPPPPIENPHDIIALVSDLTERVRQDPTNLDLLNVLRERVTAFASGVAMASAPPFVGPPVSMPLPPLGYTPGLVPPTLLLSPTRGTLAYVPAPIDATPPPHPHYYTSSGSSGTTGEGDGEAEDDEEGESEGADVEEDGEDASCPEEKSPRKGAKKGKTSTEGTGRVLKDRNRSRSSQEKRVRTDYTEFRPRPAGKTASAAEPDVSPKAADKGKKGKAASPAPEESFVAEQEPLPGQVSPSPAPPQAGWRNRIKAAWPGADDSAERTPTLEPEPSTPPETPASARHASAAKVKKRFTPVEEEEPVEEEDDARSEGEVDEDSLRHSSAEGFEDEGEEEGDDVDDEDGEHDDRGENDDGSRSEESYEDVFPFEDNIFALNHRFIFIERVSISKDIVVYKALDRETNMICAIKIADNLPDKEPKEVRIIAMSQGHECVNRLVGWFPLTSTRCYALVTEYIDGLRREDIKPFDAKQYIYDVSVALLHIHQQQIIYRDVKPSNILYSRELNRATLIDYDCSTFFDPVNLHHNEIGTDGYMAPEIVAHKAAEKAGLPPPPGYSFPVDVYSTGIVLGELLFDIVDEGETSYSQFMGLCDEAKAHPNEAPGGVTPKEYLQGCALLRRMLEQDSAKRITLPEVIAHPFFEGVEKHYAY